MVQAWLSERNISRKGKRWSSHSCMLLGQGRPYHGETGYEAEGGGPARGPLAQVAMVCSVWGTTLSSRRTLFSSTASCGSTVSRPGPVDAMAAFQRHLLGEDLHGRASCAASSFRV